MAALLRSARLLRSSPSALLQLTGTRGSGPPLGRLCSAALGGRSAAGCSRLTRSASEHASGSRVWPYAAGCVRSYCAAREMRAESSIALRSKQAEQFDWALTRLDSSVRRTGRITKTLLLRIFHDICRTGYPSGNQALLLLRSCGSLLPEVPLEERTALAHHMWEKLLQLNAQFDVSHYNALLKVYLQNDFEFSPTDFLAKMEAAKIQPNRVTYQRLIAAYCQAGDIEGASTILGFMKSKDLPITEAVFNSLVTGHARSGDMESATNVLSVMRGAGIQPGPDTYIALLNAFAEKGDMDSMKKTLEAAENEDCNLIDQDMLQIIYTLAKAGYPQHVPDIVERLRHKGSRIPDAMNLCLNLVTQGLEDTAFLILKNFSAGQSDALNEDTPGFGNFFLRHCVNMGLGVEKIRGYCQGLQELNMHAAPLIFSLQCALEAKKTGLAFEIMETLKEQGLPIRPHFFCPLLSQHVKSQNTAGVLEVLKLMSKLHVQPDQDLLQDFIIPAFPSTDEAGKALVDEGIYLDTYGFTIFKTRMFAANDLGKFYTLLSDPSFPSMNHNLFRGSLALGFRKFKDVENMVKITELLHKDKRFCNENSSPVESTSALMHVMIDSMSATEVRDQEGVLRKYFNELHDKNVTILAKNYRGIKKLLLMHGVPELIEDLLPLSETDSDASESVASYLTETEGDLAVLEKRLAQLKEENKPIKSTLRQIITVLCAQGDLQRALELREQHEEDVTPGSLANLIHLCCQKGQDETALDLKRELSRKDSSLLLDNRKYFALIRVLSKNGKIEEALDILREMKEKSVLWNDRDITSTFHLLSALAVKGHTSSIQQLQDTIFVLGLAKPTNNLCSPLITAYMEKGDLAGALEALLQCHKRYNLSPRMHDIFVALVEKGETDQLQKAMDFVNQQRGEMHMLYDLFFAFLQVGRYREARRIIETPGMRAKAGRLQWYAEKCINMKQMEALEQMVDMTAKLFENDRDEMYSYLLRLCKELNNCEKAEEVWMKMQEEGIIPREKTLCLLADILKSHGKEVPFEVPESWYTQAVNAEQVKAQPVKSEATPTLAEKDKDYKNSLFSLCKKGKAKEAYMLLKTAEKSGVMLSPVVYDHVICALLAEGALENAMEVKDIAVSHLPRFKMSNIAHSLRIITLCKRDQPKDALANLKSMLQEDLLPLQMSLTRLVQGLGSQGDVAGIQEVEALVKGLGTSFNLSSMLYVNNTALAHIKNGDLETAVETIEAVYTGPSSMYPSMAFVFKKIMEDNNDEAMDKLSAMAERLANHFACYRPALDLFCQLLDMDKVEDAKFMLARCNAIAEQRDILIGYLSEKSRKPGQADKIKAMVSLIPDLVRKEQLCVHLIKSHSMDNDLQSAKALYEEMQKEGVVIDDLSLKRLAKLYRSAGETVPFTEPPESFKFYANALRDGAVKSEMTAEQ